MAVLTPPILVSSIAIVIIEVIIETSFSCLFGFIVFFVQLVGSPHGCSVGECIHPVNREKGQTDRCACVVLLELVSDIAARQV